MRLLYLLALIIIDIIAEGLNMKLERRRLSEMRKEMLEAAQEAIRESEESDAPSPTVRIRMDARERPFQIGGSFVERNLGGEEVGTIVRIDDEWALVEMDAYAVVRWATEDNNHIHYVETGQD